MRDAFVWRRPVSFHALLDLEARGLADLEADLRTLGDAVDATPGFDAPRVRSLHFLRMQIVGPASDASFQEPAPARLLLGTVHDGDLRDHLTELLDHTGSWLEPRIERHVRGAGGEGPPLIERLLASRVHEDAVFLGDAHCTAEETRSEARLREVLGELADEGRETGRYHEGSSAESIRLDLSGRIQGLAEPELPRAPRPCPSLPAVLLQWLDAARALAHPLSGLLRDEIRAWSMTSRFARTPIRRFFLGSFLWLHDVWTRLPTRLFRWFVGRVQSREVDVELRPPADEIRRLEEREDHQVQNPLSLLAQVRESPARRWILRRILAGASSATRHIWNQGRLAGIGTIHCARILQIDEGRQMLFLSDYDGSWERYLSDFLGPGRLAVVPIFTNLEGCPPTRGLFEPTPGFAPRFLEFIRHEQAPVQVWYSAFPELSMTNRLSNRRLRDGLFVESMDEEEAGQWLMELE